MKKFTTIFSLILFASISYSQGSNYSRPYDPYKVDETEKERIRRVEYQEKELFYELFNSVNSLQMSRKQHIDNKYDKEYLYRYKNTTNNWNKDLLRLEFHLFQAVDLYTENYRRLYNKYPWVRAYPANIIEHLEINNIPREKN